MNGVDNKLKNTGNNIIAEQAGWSFGGDVANKFDDHVEKSIPLYDIGHELIAKLSFFFLTEGSNCYEIGCSTAKLTKLLADSHDGRKVNILAIDKEKAMITQGRKRCNKNENIKFLNIDILEAEFEKSDLIISYYTIQFIHPKFRQILIDKIYQSLNWGGAFIIFEKVRAPDARFQDIMSSIYTDYKLENGFTPDEIISKSRSLKSVLEPFTIQGNLDMFTRAGFVDILTIFKYVCFQGFLAIK